MRPRDAYVDLCLKLLIAADANSESERQMYEEKLRQEMLVGFFDPKQWEDIAKEAQRNFERLKALQKMAGGGMFGALGAAAAAMGDIFKERYGGKRFQEAYDEWKKELPEPPKNERPDIWDKIAADGHPAPESENLFFDLLMAHIEPPKPKKAIVDAALTAKAQEYMPPPRREEGEWRDPYWAKNFVKQQRGPRGKGTQKSQPNQYRAVLLYPTKPGRIHLILPESYAMLEWPAIAEAHAPVSWLTNDEYEFKEVFPRDRKLTFVRDKEEKVGNYWEITYKPRNA